MCGVLVLIFCNSVLLQRFCSLQVSVQLAHCPEISEQGHAAVEDMANNMYPSSFAFRNLQVFHFKTMITAAALVWLFTCVVAGGCQRSCAHAGQCSKHLCRAHGVLAIWCGAKTGRCGGTQYMKVAASSSGTQCGM